MFKGCKEGHLLGLFSFFRTWFFSLLSVRRLPSFFPLNHRHSYHHLRLQAHPPLFSSFSPPLLVAFPDQASHRSVTAMEAWSWAAAAAISLFQSSPAMAEGGWAHQTATPLVVFPSSSFSFLCDLLLLPPLFFISFLFAAAMLAGDQASTDHCCCYSYCQHHPRWL